MFIRRKTNKSGTVSVHIVSKVDGKYKTVMSIGAGRTETELQKLERKAQDEITRRLGQLPLDLEFHQDQLFETQFYQGLENIELVGPELVLGKLYDEIGFNQVPEILFRHLVLTRVVHPGSKLNTVEYLWRYHGLSFSTSEVYRFLDRIYNDYQSQIEDISFSHTRSLMGGNIHMVFYDVTTLYFEAESEDDLRKTGFSKDGKSQHPQIVLGLLVSQGGYPLAFQMFEGNTFEGHTFLSVLDAFKKRFSLKDITVIADAGLLSNENIKNLRANEYRFVLGARIKNESSAVKKMILSLGLKHGQVKELERSDGTRLIISYSDNRAKKDKFNRERGLKKLEHALDKGKLSKAHINNRGYNKYLTIEGDLKVKIDYEKFKLDDKWDGLKGYITDSNLTAELIIDSYKQLWQIEKAFRISKTDLRVRPIYHRAKRRIQAHLCIAFCSYKIYKELERRLKQSNSPLSTEKAIEVIKTIFRVSARTPVAKKAISRIWLAKKEQEILLSCLGIPFD